MTSLLSSNRSALHWFDATSLLRLRHHLPVGLTRVEVPVLQGALALSSTTAAFGRYNKHARSFEAVARAKIEKLVAGYGTEPKIMGATSVTSQHVAGKPKSARFIKRLGRQLELGARKLIRGPVQSTLRQVTGRTSEVQFSSGDKLIISGSTWDTFDPEWLEGLVTQRGVDLVCILADMIPWKFPHQFHDSHAVQQFIDFAEVLARYGSCIACISNSTQSDFQSFSKSRGIIRDKSEVILLGTDLPGEATPIEGLPEDLLTRGYILSVSTIQVRKNQQLLYHLWRRFAEENRSDFPRLILVGANGWLTEDLRRQIVSDPLTKDSIVILNSVSDAHLQWLYQNCRFTLYPSLYEGWGLPIVESLQHGKACIASNTSSMPEASQNLAVHLDPHDFVSWHTCILRWTENMALLSDVEQTIRRQFRPRSWHDFTKEFLSRAAAA